jgi:hypothetical protein
MENNSGSNYTAIAGTDTTHLMVTKNAFDNDTDDDYNGDYVYNVTRGVGKQVTDYDADDGSNRSVLVMAAITGQTTGDTFFIIRAWRTVEQFTTTTTRTAGDLAYVRANTTENVAAAAIAFDEAGTNIAYIEIRGASSTDDPWHDASNVLPILNFQDSAASYALVNKDFWKFTRLSFIQSAYGSGNVSLATNPDKIYFSGCNFADNSHATTGYGLYVSGASAIVDTCTFGGNLSSGIAAASGSYVKVLNSTFNGTAHTQSYGIRAMSAGRADVVNCTFGQTTPHGTADMRNESGTIRTRNCLFNIAPTFLTTLGAGTTYHEDYNQTYGDHRSSSRTGDITTETTNIRTGGASTSAHVVPTSFCGLYDPVTLNWDYELVPDFRVWCTAGTARTVAVYIRADAAWSTYPTASTLYTESSYYSNASTCARSTAVSSQVLSDGSTWVAFTNTFTPLRAGWVYIKVYLKLYESGKGIYCDLKPIIT